MIQKFHLQLVFLIIVLFSPKKISICCQCMHPAVLGVVGCMFTTKLPCQSPKEQLALLFIVKASFLFLQPLTMIFLSPLPKATISCFSIPDSLTDRDVLLAFDGGVGSMSRFSTSDTITNGTIRMGALSTWEKPDTRATEPSITLSLSLSITLIHAHRPTYAHT